METHLVKVVDGPTLTVPTGVKLVLALEENGVDVSHRCGGQAKCTTCRVNVTDSEPAMGAPEHDCLEEDGVLGQFRLSCQIRVDSDMTVEVLMSAASQGWTAGQPVEA